MRPVTRVIAAATVALLLPACGSTVQDGSTVTSGGFASSTDATQAGGDSGLVVPAGSGGVVGAGPGVGAVGTGTVGGDLGSAASGSVGGASSAAPVGSTAVSGPGVTPTTVTLGVSYYRSAKTANEALGARGVDTGDPVASTRVLIAAINKAGGIAGRHVVALFYAIDPQSSEPYATEAQSECAFFTDDHQVFAVIDGAPAADPRICLAKHGVADLRGSLLADPLTVNEIDAYSSTMDRAFAALVPSLLQQGYFSPWNRLAGAPGTARAKLGIVSGNTPGDQRAIKDVLIPALRRIGYGPDPADIYWLNQPQGFNDDGATAAAIDNAVLKLNADGVDHVILNDSNGSLSLLFNNYAYSQNYFPRYGGTSGNAWQIFLTAGDLQPKTLHGAMGIGWQPLFDVPYQTGDGPDANAARHRCLQIFARAGMRPTDGATAGSYAEGCDVGFLIPAALGGYTGPITLSTLLQRVNRLGSSYQLASGFGSRFAADQHDGNGAFKPMAFHGSCNCIGYTGTVQSLPR